MAALSASTIPLPPTVYLTGQSVFALGSRACSKQMAYTPLITVPPMTDRMSGMPRNPDPRDPFEIGNLVLSGRNLLYGNVPAPLNSLLKASVLNLVIITPTSLVASNYKPALKILPTAFEK